LLPWQTAAAIFLELLRQMDVVDTAQGSHLPEISLPN